MYKAYSKVRDAKGLTDYEVAKKSGIPQSTIYDWKQRSEVNENASISVPSLMKICAVMGCSLVELLDQKP